MQQADEERPAVAVEAADGLVQMHEMQEAGAHRAAVRQGGLQLHQHFVRLVGGQRAAAGDDYHCNLGPDWRRRMGGGVDGTGGNYTRCRIAGGRDAAFPGGDGSGGDFGYTAPVPIG